MHTCRLPGAPASAPYFLRLLMGCADFANMRKQPADVHRLRVYAQARVVWLVVEPFSWR